MMSLLPGLAEPSETVCVTPMRDEVTKRQGLGINVRTLDRHRGLAVDAVRVKP